MSLEQPITTSRLGRLGQLGRLAGGIAGNLIGESAKRLVQGEQVSMGRLLLSPVNARRLTDQLSAMRGAAMKVGQMLSMEGGYLLPPQLSQTLSALRDNAHVMPLGDVGRVLGNAWGPGWEKKFSRFFFTPIAAASIGQVHEAYTKKGERLAVKIQYPGIRRSIDSDVDNVATLLRMFRLLPEEFDLGALLEDAKAQLHAEADYMREAAALKRYADSVAEDPRFEVPKVVDPLTTPEVLVMSYIDGQPIEELSDLPDNERTAVGYDLLELALREVFTWGLVQTDPNYANYKYDANNRRIQLLDFGAVRDYPTEQRTALVRLLTACAEGDEANIMDCATIVGYLEEEDPNEYRNFVVRLLLTATEPVRIREGYDFGRPDLAQRMSNLLIDMRLRSRFGRIPPPEILFLHRKLAGLYLLLTHLRVRLPVWELVRRYL